MKLTAFYRYYGIVIGIVLVLAAYPLYMGICVTRDMLCCGEVLAADYPKYIIPYTPVSLAVLCGVLCLPWALRYLKRAALPLVSLASTGLFWITEHLLETAVIVKEEGPFSLVDWQTYSCYIQSPRHYTPEQILFGEYTPAFKLHFYMIAIVLILVLLNSVYGFGQLIRNGQRQRKTALILQSLSAALFLGLCILACFTAFFRTGALLVSPLSAALMILFFVTLGVTVGLYVGSFLLRRSPWISLGLPAAAAIASTVLMYVGESILLNGKVYRLGVGPLFDSIGKAVLAPIDVLTILLSSLITTVILLPITRRRSAVSDT